MRVLIGLRKEILDLKMIYEKLGIPANLQKRFLENYKKEQNHYAGAKICLYKFN
jgi:hypothetical protein